MDDFLTTDKIPDSNYWKKFSYPQKDENMAETSVTGIGSNGPISDGSRYTIGVDKLIGKKFEKRSEIKGLITFFINVGQLAPEKAMFFAKSLHEQTFYPELKQRLADSGYEVVMLPTRDQPTQIGVVPL